MKKVLNFDKEINFPTMIGEITSISLDHTLKFTSGSDIEGSFFIKGTYKMTEASHLEEEFDYNIPIDIALTENLDINTCKVEIEDFYYEIVNEDTLSCKIDVLVEGLEDIVLEEESVEEDPVLEDPAEEIEVIDETFVKDREEVLVRECDGEEKEEEEKEIPKRKDINFTQEKVGNNMKIEKDFDPMIEVTKESSKTEHMESIFTAFKDTEETFVSYSVYILRKNDTLDKIYDLYNVTHEELSNYNDLENLEIGSKIIIPTQKVNINE